MYSSKRIYNTYKKTLLPITPLRRIRKTKAFAVHKDIRIQYVSDIHLEENEKPSIQKSGDYLVLAGDIGSPFDDSYIEFLDDMSQKYKRVFIIPGNHEYFFQTMNATNLHLTYVTSEFENVHLLNNTLYDIEDDLRIIGTPLWTNMNHLTSLYISDFSNIKTQNETYITIKQHRKLHEQSKQFIRDQIDIARKEKRQLIVVTHHAPHYDMLGEVHKTSYNKDGYATNLEDLFVEPIVAWISGHTHQSIKTYVNGIPCLSNCYGTNEKERVTYTPDAVLTLRYE